MKYIELSVNLLVLIYLLKNKTIFLLIRLKKKRWKLICLENVFKLDRKKKKLDLEIFIRSKNCESDVNGHGNRYKYTRARVYK